MDFNFFKLTKNMYYWKFLYNILYMCDMGIWHKKYK